MVVELEDSYRPRYQKEVISLRYNQVIDAGTHVNIDLGNILMKEMTEAAQGVFARDGANRPKAYQLA